MRVLIVLAEPLPPQASGGSQKAAFEIATGLARLGDAVGIAGRLDTRKRSGLLPLAGAMLRGRRFTKERRNGASVYRFFRDPAGFDAVLASFAPDVVLIHAMSAMPIAHQVGAHGIPLVIYWHDVEFHKLRGTPDGLAGRFVANSGFTAAAVRERFGIASTVVPPIFAPPPRSDASHTGRSVLFVNPVADKGLAHALAIVRACPDIPFEFLESWTLDTRSRRELSAALAGLPNVILTPRQSDMAPVFARTRLLIAPSRWQEAWGRVSTEAQACGIPVLATAIGGLSEAVGSGGVLFAPDVEPDVWAEEVRRIWRDPARFAELSTAAHARAAQPDVDPERNIARLRAELRAAIDDAAS